MIEALNVLVLLGNGVVAGVLFAIALAVMPALIVMPPDRYIETHRLIGRNWDPTMPLIVLSSCLVDVVLAVAAGPGAARTLYVVGAALLLGVAAVSHLANVPINRRIKHVDPLAIPDDWQDPRRLWRNWNLLRAVFAAIALVANACALALA